MATVPKPSDTEMTRAIASSRGCRSPPARTAWAAWSSPRRRASAPGSPGEGRMDGMWDGTGPVIGPARPPFSAEMWGASVRAAPRAARPSPASDRVRGPPARRVSTPWRSEDHPGALPAEASPQSHDVGDVAPGFGKHPDAPDRAQALVVGGRRHGRIAVRVAHQLGEVERPGLDVVNGRAGVQPGAREVGLDPLPRAGQDLHDPARVGAREHAVVEAALLPRDGGGERAGRAVAGGDRADLRGAEARGRRGRRRGGGGPGRPRPGPGGGRGNPVGGFLPGRAGRGPSGPAPSLNP